MNGGELKFLGGIKKKHFRFLQYQGSVQIFHLGSYFYEFYSFFFFVNYFYFFFNFIPIFVKKLHAMNFSDLIEIKHN